MLTFLSIILRTSYLKIKIKNKNTDFNDNYTKINLNLNLTFHNINKRKNKINIAIYAFSIKNGGRSRITALLINYLYKINIFKIFLFTLKIIEEDEYVIPMNIKRFQIKNHLIKIINKNKIDILIYELDNIEEIIKLNNLMNVKIIFYQHSSSFDWIYDNYTAFKEIYKAFSKSKYIISIVPFDSDYLFNKWGINTILMSNFMTFDFNNIFTSDLSTQNILMIGRGDAKKKRFYIGIEAMEYIIKERQACKLNIISSLKRIDKIKKLVDNLNLSNNINFNGYSSSVEIYFRNASLNLVPSISESFSLVLSETKIYGIPSIVLGLDYIFTAEGGIIIIYDDLPESLALESIKIISNSQYRKKLSKEARISMKKFNNEFLLKQWVKLIISAYKGESYYYKLREEYKKLSENNALKILNNQVKLLKLRYKAFRNITPKEFENFTYINTFHIENL